MGNDSAKITREPLCKVAGCPEPRSEEWHHCFVCGKAEGDHQHFPKKSLAGKGAKIVAFLCRNHHEKITLHQWREGVYTHPDGSKRYYVQNQKGVEQCERIIEAAPEEVPSRARVAPTANGAALSGAEPAPEARFPAVKEADAPALARIWDNESDEEAFEEHKDDPEEWEDEPTPAIVSPAVKEEEKDANRKAPEELQGETVESGEAAQDSTDEALPQDARDRSGALHGVVGQPATQRVRQGESDLDAEGLGSIGLGESAPAPEVHAIATSQIGATGQKALVGGLPPTDLTDYSDEQLATLFAWADKQQKDSFLTKCHVVHAYRERHVQAWGESWLEEAYKLFEGSPSRRTLEAYANIWACVTTDASLLEHIGPLTDSRNLMQFIGRKKPEDGRIALEAAVAHLAKFGEAPTVPVLTQMLGEEAKPDLCPKTGLPHNWQRVCRDCGKGKG